MSNEIIQKIDQVLDILDSLQEEYPVLKDYIKTWLEEQEDEANVWSLDDLSCNDNCSRCTWRQRNES